MKFNNTNSKYLELQADVFLLKSKNKLSKKKRKGIETKLPKLKYHQYIKSKLWRDRRFKYFKDNKKECQACTSSLRIALHHISYQRLGNELDDDLIPLCWECHGEYHRKYKNDKLFKNTNIFIDEKLQEKEASVLKWI